VLPPPIPMTPAGNWRYMIIRFYWDGEKEPSVECPVGDFFACGWGKYAHVNSLPVCVNPGSAFNCYWEMPFRKKCRITMENIGEKQATKKGYRIPSEGLAMVLRNYFDTCEKQSTFTEYLKEVIEQTGATPEHIAKEYKIDAEELKKLAG